MAVTVNAGPEYKPLFFTGLSTDTKPTTWSAPGNENQDIPDRSEFLETDTGTTYVMHGATWFIVAADYHQRIHDGQAYDFGYVWQGVVNNGVAEFILELTSAAHVVPVIAAGGDAIFTIFRNPTYTGGTAVTITNKNEYSTNTSDAVAKRDPAVTVDGTQIHIEGLMGGSGGNAAGGQHSFEREHILKGGNNYLFRLTNISGTSQNLYIGPDYYHP